MSASSIHTGAQVGSAVINLVAKGKADAFLTTDATAEAGPGFKPAAQVSREHTTANISYNQAAEYQVQVQVPRHADKLVGIALTVTSSELVATEGTQGGTRVQGQSVVLMEQTLGCASMSHAAGVLVKELEASEHSEASSVGSGVSDRTESLRSHLRQAARGTVMAMAGRTSGGAAAANFAQMSHRRSNATAVRRLHQQANALQAYAESTNGEPQAVWVSGLPYFLIKKMSIEIGSGKIDDLSGLASLMIHRFYGSALTNPHTRGFYDNVEQAVTWASGERQYILDVPFAINKDSALGIKLARLQYHSVQINATYEDLSNLIIVYGDADKHYRVTTAEGNVPKIDSSFTFTMEYMQNSANQGDIEWAETMDIIQTHSDIVPSQMVAASDEGTTFNWSSTLPTIAIIVACRHQTAIAAKQYHLFDALGENPVSQVKLYAQGCARISLPSSFAANPAMQNFKGDVDSKALHGEGADGNTIMGLSFAGNPMDHGTNSGYLNCARVENLQIELKWSKQALDMVPCGRWQVTVINVTYNMLRYASGMGGLMFS